MYTIAGTPGFRHDVNAIRDTEQRLAFCEWLAANPEAGAVIPGSDERRKVRWAASGRGERSGVRGIYYSRLDEGRIWLLVIYAKAVRGKIPARILGAIKEAP